eukprot:CAMPEP_0174250346 /NCGR_PEP_ID=MMETSP0439-20130205/544_1 /TAXON_ID=0 /ORGANISM="Stereomyxa ramosa, Strain Chinc5" /LENGTH=363 /DNA_ID=CAMNT_0015330383 /DNA_START=296 /DNA_END=1387 /DNA_ORIENTATION=-
MGKGIAGVVINSKCANACTGEQGLKDAKQMSFLAGEATGRNLGKDGERFLVMSTGVIGKLLDMNKIKEGIHNASLCLQGDYDSWVNAASAIMTTDTTYKFVHHKFRGTRNDDSDLVIAGIAKGSGMINPNMATMLSVLVTNENISPSALDVALHKAVNKSFNRISVDGDTSTNDMVAVLSSGEGKGRIELEDTKPNSPKYASFCSFQEHLTDVCIDLAKKLVKDGEGATKFVEINVQNAKSDEDAHTVAKSVANSLLVKTALFGCDANWGRIMCAVGYSGANVIPSQASLNISSIASVSSLPVSISLFTKGRPEDVDETLASKIMKAPEIKINVDLANGNSNTTVWTSDLSFDYVKINTDYRS